MKPFWLLFVLQLIAVAIFSFSILALTPKRVRWLMNMNATRLDGSKSAGRLSRERQSFQHHLRIAFWIPFVFFALTQTMGILAWRSDPVEALVLSENYDDQVRAKTREHEQGRATTEQKKKSAEISKSESETKGNFPKLDSFFESANRPASWNFTYLCIMIVGWLLAFVGVRQAYILAVSRYEKSANRRFQEYYQAHLVQQQERAADAPPSAENSAYPGKRSILEMN